MAKRTDERLDRYREKRDPATTTEPFEPARRTAQDATHAGGFVVHLHAATRRHYDLRIEVGTALLSFAVPKGPSLDPAIRRLAIQTEDHPLTYLDFEGIIPAGNYGAGAMIVWDRGRVRYRDSSAEAGLAAGKIDMDLAGHKLRGRFTLVRTGEQGGKSQWLLLKKSDPFCQPDVDLTRSAPESIVCGLTVDQLPNAEAIDRSWVAHAAQLAAPKWTARARSVTPMLCRVSDETVLQRANWYYELKLDGVRIVAEKEDDRVSLYYRTQRAATVAYPEVARAVAGLFPAQIVLDGEIIAADEGGRPDFQRLQQRIQAADSGEALALSATIPTSYLVFDVLRYGDHDLRPLSLKQRKAVLREIVPRRGLVQFLDHLEDDGRPLYAFCLDHGLEGVIAKNAEASYTTGPRRTADWLKIKRQRQEDFVVVGWTQGTGGRNSLGALDLATHASGTWIVRGKVGGGMTQEILATLEERLQAIEVDQPMATGDWGPASRGRRYVRPEIVVSVRFTEWTDGGALRAPVFAGLRNDLPPQAATAAPPEKEKPAADDRSVPPPSPAGDTRLYGERRLRLSNQNKVFWPELGLTKGDLCHYYETVAPAILPYLQDRPVVLVRYPDGVEGKHFYQWRAPRGTPSWIRTFPFRFEEASAEERLTFIVDDADTLLYLANLGCIPLHLIASRTASLDHPDWLTLDLDLGAASLSQAVELAQELRNILTDIGLAGLAKTSGRSGLHVLVPLGPGASWTTAKTLAELLGRILTQRHPTVATMERTKAKRGDRVLVDVGQTGPSRTIVAPWSLRAVAHAGVSTPLSWEEVGIGLDPRRYTLPYVAERASTQTDPMARLLSQRADLPAAIEALAALLPRRREPEVP